MRVLSTLLIILPSLMSPLIGIVSGADDQSTPPPTDPEFTQIDAVFRRQFKDASIIKVERKEKQQFNMLLSFYTHTNVFYRLTVSDPLNKKFDVTYASDATLVNTDKYRTPISALPSKVQTAIEALAPNSSTSTEPIEARLEKGVYKVSGKIGGKKFNVEVNVVDEKPATPAPQLGRALTPEPEHKILPQPAAPVVPSDKVEIAAKVDGPFRALFKDATILRIDHKETPNVTIHVFSIGGGSKYELTLADDLNKKFKATFTDSGHLYNTSNYLTPFNRLPSEVQSAVEKMTNVPDPTVVLDVRVDHKMILQSEHEEYKINGKINGVKINLDVPVYSK